MTETVGGINTTDILDRYRIFARDYICADPMVWMSGEDDQFKEKKGH